MAKFRLYSRAVYIGKKKRIGYDWFLEINWYRSIDLNVIVYSLQVRIDRNLHRV